jgi:CRP-like cAMP-binding protein
MTDRSTAREYRELLRTGRWFGSLPHATQDALLASASVRRLARGQVATSPGTESDGLFAIVDGSIEVRSVHADGTPVVHMFMDPPSWFGEGSVIDRPPAFLETVAAVPSVLVHVPLRRMRVLLGKDPELWQQLARLANYHLQLALAALVDFGAGTQLQRVARRLVLMVDGYGDHAHRKRAIRIHQENLASTMNMSRQTVNRLLKRLEARAWIRTRYGEIEVLDRAALVALAGLPGLLPE